MTRTAFRTCPFCEATCGLAIEVDDDGAVVSVRGDADDVFSRGFICPKGAAFGAYHTDPDRLRAPLIKRDGRHVEVSWDEAFAEVEARLPPILEERGRDAVAVYAGNPSVHNMAGAIYGRALFKALRTRNLFTASTVDQMPKHLSSGLLFGHPMSIPVPDLDRTDYLIILGANPAESNGSVCTAPDFIGRVRRIQERGGKVVVVDPRRTRTARQASEHLFIRPGGDAALLIAIARILIREQRVAIPGPIAAHLSGLESLTAALEDLELDALAAACGIDLDTITRIARELSDAPSAAVYGRIGTTTVTFGTLASYLVDALNLLTGNLDRPGGAMFARPAHVPHRPDREPGGRGFQVGRWTSRVEGLSEVMSEFPAATMAAEIETPGDGQVRALITIAGNPVLSNPNSARLDAALASLDFMVSVDPYLNETTRHADVILPPPSHLTQGAYHLAFYHFAVRNVAHYAGPTVPAPEGALDDAEILMRLALIASGQGAAAPTAFLDAMILRTVVDRELDDPASPLFGLEPPAVIAELSGSGAERVLDFLLRAGPYGDHFGRRPEGLSLEALAASGHGVDLGPLEPRIPEILSTPSGTIELWHPTIAGELERLRSSLDQRPPPFVLIGRRHLRSNNSWMHNIPLLVSGKPRCTLLIHPADAGALGVGAGDPVTVTSRVGSVTIAAELTGDIMPGVVSIPHGWGHDAPGARLSVAADHPGVNTNLLTDESDLDGPTGTAVLNGIPVELAAAWGDLHSPACEPR
jgi:anaerobic selenocysteine-containing dehydrogenase